MSRIAVYIDGGYLDYALRHEFNMARIDYNQLAGFMADGIEILRTYYYHCLPYQGDPPTTEESQRIASMQSFLASLERLPRFQVRLGKLAHRGVRDDGSPILEQKRVDIQLGVDLVQLSAKQQITHAALLTGDSDFLPAVHVAKAEGVMVKLVHCKGSPPHRELWSECDERIVLGQEAIDGMLRS